MGGVRVCAFMNPRPKLLCIIAGAIVGFGSGHEKKKKKKKKRIPSLFKVQIHARSTFRISLPPGERLRYEYGTVSSRWKDMKWMRADTHTCKSTFVPDKQSPTSRHKYNHHAGEQKTSCKSIIFVCQPSLNPPPASTPASLCGPGYI